MRDYEIGDDICLLFEHFSLFRDRKIPQVKGKHLCWLFHLSDSPKEMALLTQLHRIKPRVGLLFRHENRKGMWVNFLSEYAPHATFDSPPLSDSCVGGL